MVETGEEVWALTPFDRDGVAAEYAAVPADVLAPRPQSLSHVEAAAVPMTGLSAWQGLFAFGGLESGERVEITGAAGGVGHVAVQLANWRGGHVVADQPADLVFDTVGNVSPRNGGSRLVSIAEESEAGKYFVVEPDRGQLADLAGLVEAGGCAPRSTACSRLPTPRRRSSASQTGAKLARSCCVSSTTEKAEAFRALHAGEPFVIPNPWDAGSARVLEALGFKALATTSSGFAFTLGAARRRRHARRGRRARRRARRRDRRCRSSVDLENGYGAEPEAAARAITRVAEAGAVGGSIEDWDPRGRLYDLQHATERVAAAVEAARALPFPFTLTGRAENHIRGNPDLDDTIARLQAYEAAGADVLYAPGLRTPDEIRAVCEAVDEAGQRARAAAPDVRRDRRGRRAARQRRRRADVDGGRRGSPRPHGDPRPRRLLAAGLGRAWRGWLR